MAVAQASVYIDIDKRRIYEVPPGASYAVDGGGFRIYDDGPVTYAQTYLDVQKDIWSRGVDWWAAGHDYAAFPLVRSGGAFRGYDVFGGEQYATNDYKLRADEDGWRIVLADYTHECIIVGNLDSDNADGIMFDDSRLTAIAKPRMRGADSLQTYRFSAGSGLDAVQSEKLDELHKAEFNKRVWNKTGSTITLYDDDGVTPLYVFPTNADMSNIDAGVKQ